MPRRKAEKYISSVGDIEQYDKNHVGIPMTTHDEPDRIIYLNLSTTELGRLLQRLENAHRQMK